MREAYQAQLAGLADELATMCLQAATAMRQATTALMESNLAVAEQVISDDAKIDAMRAAVEEQCVTLLALQAPVATDLRTIVSSIHAAGDIERMGDLALHIAESARRRHPHPVLPAQVQPYFAEMGRVACELASDTAEVVRCQDVEKASAVETDDDAMDDLHRHMFTVLMAPDWPHSVAEAVDVTLLGRFYERYADHAVSVARRVVYAVTGQMPDPLKV